MRYYLYHYFLGVAGDNLLSFVVIKSTVEPGTSRMLYSTYNLNILHNPEFLSAKTAVKDFENQNHIVIGKYSDEDNKNSLILEKLYQENWKDVEISKCLFEESEMMKISVNCFYAVKIQFFNEIYSLSKKYKANYQNLVQ